LLFVLQFMVNEMAFPPGGQDGKPKRGYMATPEDTYYNLAQYYDIPTLSFRCTARCGTGCWRGGVKLV
jgi:hypothetical protein